MLGVGVDMYMYCGTHPRRSSAESGSTIEDLISGLGSGAEY